MKLVLLLFGLVVVSQALPVAKKLASSLDSLEGTGFGLKKEKKLASLDALEGTDFVFKKSLSKFCIIYLYLFLRRSLIVMF